MPRSYGAGRRIGLCALLALLLLMASGAAAEGLIDSGHSTEGYVTVRQEITERKLLVTISKGDETYTYSLNGAGKGETYPLQMGDGRYLLKVYRHLQGAQYLVIDRSEFDVRLSSPEAPYLYPSQYVNYDADAPAVQKARALCKNAKSEREAADAVFNYIRKSVKYDKKKARKVRVGYLPSPDETLSTRKGICFDYAALMACMLRAQGIPTQLVIGYMNGKSYHAWNKVLIGGEWRLYDATLAAAGGKARSYREERRY